MSFPKMVKQMGSFGEKRKKLFFRFCWPILDIFRIYALKTLGIVYLLILESFQRTVQYLYKEEHKSNTVIRWKFSRSS